MADNAIGNISASVFMDEVKASFGGKLSYEPDDANDKWIYAEVTVGTSSGDLLSTSYTYLGTTTSVASGDKYKWVAIKNLDSSNSILVSQSAGTVAHSGSTANAGMLIEPNELFIAKMPQSTQADVHAVAVTVATSGAISASTSSVQAQVAALMDDVG
tara:strand:- start:830 stop:1303 length:474 start_codon:yes stop_codon:yes gene_type:complete